MRLPLIPPAELSAEQRSLYDAMRKGIASNFNAFKVEREDGALMGPWNPWLHEPAIGKAIWDLTLAMTANATLPDTVRQIAILVVGARFDAAYEIYAHIAVAEREGMKPERLAALVADLKPNDLAPDENVARRPVGGSGGLDPDCFDVQVFVEMLQPGLASPEIRCRCDCHSTKRAPWR